MSSAWHWRASFPLLLAGVDITPELTRQLLMQAAEQLYVQPRPLGRAIWSHESRYGPAAQAS